MDFTRMKSVIVKWILLAKNMDRQYILVNIRAMPRIQHCYFCSAVRHNCYSPDISARVPSPFEMLFSSILSPRSILSIMSRNVYTKYY